MGGGAQGEGRGREVGHRQVEIWVGGRQTAKVRGGRKVVFGKGEAGTDTTGVTAVKERERQSERQKGS